MILFYYLLLLNACVRVADVMTFTFVSLMPVHNVCRICMIIKDRPHTLENARQQKKNKDS